MHRIKILMIEIISKKDPYSVEDAGTIAEVSSMMARYFYGGHNKHQRNGTSDIDAAWDRAAE
jgi:hypothetical protein